MALPPSGPTYAFIPPPPLPEFYASSSSKSSSSFLSATAQEKLPSKAVVKTKTKAKVSASKQRQTADNTAQAIAAQAQLLPAIVEDASDKLKMVTFEASRPTAAPVITIPRPPPGYAGDVPPLAVYHICRLCLRPRSASYHQEHPIPINGLPPPPGICRRCRVLKVDEQYIKEKAQDRKGSDIEIIRDSRSNEMRLGLFQGIRGSDYVTREQWEDMRVRRLLQEAERQQTRDESSKSSEVEDIHYRHVRVREQVDCPTRAEQVASNVLPCLPKPKTHVYSTAQDAIDQISSHSTERFVMKTYETSQRAATAKRAVVEEKASHDVAQVESAVHPSKTKALATAKASPCANSSRSKSTIRADAKVDLEVPKPARSESEIRRIAREEVIKYRQAERKLQAHPDPYAHGRMIPVERRIASSADAEEPKPWLKESIEVHIEKGTRPSTAEEVVASAQSQRGSEKQQGYKAPSHDGYLETYDSSARSKESSRPRLQATNTSDLKLERSPKPEQREKSVSAHAVSRTSNQAPSVAAKSTTTEQRSLISERTKWFRTREEARPMPIQENDVLAGESWEGCRLPSPNKYNVIEVIEEVQLPPEHSYRRNSDYNRIDSLVSERAKDAWAGGESDDRSKTSSFVNQHIAGQRSTRHTDREYQVDADWDVRAMSEEHLDNVTRWPAASERTVRSVHSREDPPNECDGTERVRAYDRRMSAVAERDRPRDAPTDDGRPWSRRRNTASAASTRPSAPPDGARRDASRSPDYEWTHIERIFQPVDQPWERNPFENREAEYRVESEEFQRNTRHCKTASQASVPRSHAQSSHQRTKTPSRQSERPNGRRKAKVSPSETSTARVRFANKVEFSPTPPGSDASSSQFRIIGPRGGRTRTKAKLNEGGEESAEDLIAEYERRGRARARDRAGREGGQYVAESTKIWEREREWGGSAKQSVDGAGEEWPHGDGIDDPRYRPRQSKPLTQALSESPSRENLSEAFSASRAIHRSNPGGHGTDRAGKLGSRMTTLARPARAVGWQP